MLRIPPELSNFHFSLDGVPTPAFLKADGDDLSYILHGHLSGLSLKAETTLIPFSYNAKNWLVDMKQRLSSCLSSTTQRQLIGKKGSALWLASFRESFPECLDSNSSSDFFTAIQDFVDELHRDSSNTFFTMPAAGLDKAYQAWCKRNKRARRIRCIDFPFYERDWYLRGVNRVPARGLSSNPAREKRFLVFCAHLPLFRADFFSELIARELLETFFYSCLDRDHFFNEDYVQSLLRLQAGRGRLDPNLEIKIRQFFAACPHHLDSLVSDDDISELLPMDFCEKSWIHIALETSFSQHSCPFVTEKTFKALTSGQAFLIFGNPGTLKYLHQLGYKSFPMLFDESYDENKSEEDRFLILMNEISRYATMSETQIRNLLLAPEIQSIIQHNKQHFQRINIEQRRIERLNLILNERRSWLNPFGLSQWLPSWSEPSVTLSNVD